MLKTQTWAAGQTVNFRELATFFRLLKAPSDITVTFLLGGRVLDIAEGVMAGYAESWPDTFDEISIYSPTSQTIQFVLRYKASAQYDAQSLTVTPAPVVMTTAFTQVKNTVGIASALLVSSNPGRKYLAIQNRGGTPIYLDFAGNPAVINDDVELLPGQLWESTAYSPAGNITAISTAANGAVIVVEG